MMPNPSNPKLNNPCVRNCCLDQEDVCLGCGRTLEEITGWSRFSQEQKLLVLKQAEERRKQRNPWQRD